MTVFCLVELDGDAVADASLRALTLARGLAAGAVTGSPPWSFGARTAPAADLAAYGADDVYVVSGIDGYAPQAWARALAELSLRGTAPGTRSGGRRRDGPRQRGAGAPGCDHRPADGGELRRRLPAGAGALDIVRQRWAGLLLEEAVLDAPIALLTVATDAGTAAPADAPGACRRAPGHAVAQRRRPRGAGRGVAGRRGRRLARRPPAWSSAAAAASAAPTGSRRSRNSPALLGGVVGVSRVVTSEGWRPHSMQVGQTGTKITPDLYLACGISGAIQHFAGCAGAKHIIAINTDPSAPMMTRADYAVVGDLHEVLPALIKALRARPSGG